MKHETHVIIQRDEEITRITEIHINRDLIHYIDWKGWVSVIVWSAIISVAVIMFWVWFSGPAT